MVPVSCTGAPVDFSPGDSETRMWPLRERLAIADLDEMEIMIFVLLVFLGGVLTILSPCILPVLPFVFARSEQKFLTSGLPMLIGMAVTFAGIATLAAVGGAWAVRINDYGRVLALILLGISGAALLSEG